MTDMNFIYFIFIIFYFLLKISTSGTYNSVTQMDDGSFTILNGNNKLASLASLTSTRVESLNITSVFTTAKKYKPM